MSRLFLLFLLLFPFVCSAAASPPRASQRQAVFDSLDPTSIRQHFAFFQLYPHTNEGKRALQTAWTLLSPKGRTLPSLSKIPRPPCDLFVELFSSLPQESLLLDETTLSSIEQMASFLCNRKLRGHSISSMEELLQLPTEEIDVSRNLLLLELDKEENTWARIRSYDAAIDLMALQILTRTSLTASPQEKIDAINYFLFDEMAFRFPPHSLWAKEVDQYTFLPAVLDSRQGVCLGISILYLALAQRLDLPLYTVTPPGHIYVCCPTNKGLINVETTARGVHLDDKIYRSLNTRSLQARTNREVLGLSYINKASVYWEAKEHEKAKECFETAALFVENDRLLCSLRGYNALLRDQPEEAKAFILQAKELDDPTTLVPDSIIDEVLNGHLSKDAIAAVFMLVDSKRSSVEKKKEALQTALKENPNSTSLLYHLATAHLQLQRQAEALKLLQNYHEKDQSHPTVEYLLSALFTERLNYPEAWNHLIQAEKLTAELEVTPKPLHELRLYLMQRSPR